MRTMKRLSPTALHKWEEDREEFYIRYLSDQYTVQPQTEPMSVGSAFDAFVKAELHTRYYDEPDPEYDRTTLFETQVESDCRDFAWSAGGWCWDRYKAVGAYADLCELADKATTQPRFEFHLREEINGIPLQGKPDMEFELQCPVIHDWKVNGYCSRIRLRSS